MTPNQEQLDQLQEKWLKAEINGLKEFFNEQYKHTHTKLDNIAEQNAIVKKEVKQLKEETEFFRILGKNKILLFLVITGISASSIPDLLTLVSGL